MTEEIKIEFDTEPNWCEMVGKLSIELAEMEKRVVLLERVFGRLMQFDLRLDNLEFHSGQPIKPALNESMMEMKLRLSALEEFTGLEKPVIRNDD